MINTIIPSPFSFTLNANAEVDGVCRQVLNKELLSLLENGKYNLSYNVPHSFEFNKTEYYSILEKIGKLYGSLWSMFVVSDSFILLPDVLNTTNNVVTVTFSFYLNNQSKRYEIIDRIFSIIASYKSKSRVVSIEWAIQTREGIRYHNIKSLFDEIICDEAYPYINGVNSYVETYLNNRANVLILIGSPGTGKTRFIKHIIQTMVDKNNKEIRVLYSMDDKVFSEDDFFLKFLTSDYDALVLEDIDFNLKSRKDGNTFMYKLLGGSDGLIKNKKKIILSTNLPNANDIDEALLRPGRTFDVLHTRKLHYDEACLLFKKLNGDSNSLIDDTEKFSLAEIYNHK